MRDYQKIALFGFLTWLVPFAVAVPMHNSEGVLLIDEGIFASIMLIVATITAAVLLALYFKNARGDYLRQGVIIGVAWLAINYGFDLLVLVALFGMGAGEHFRQIGLGYLAIPPVPIAIGYILAKRSGV